MGLCKNRTTSSTSWHESSEKLGDASHVHSSNGIGRVAPVPARSRPDIQLRATMSKTSCFRSRQIFEWAAVVIELSEHLSEPIAEQDARKQRWPPSRSMPNFPVPGPAQSTWPMAQ